MADATRDPLPSDEQRRLLCDLLADALVDIRTADEERAHALAYALHNLPRIMWGWGTWSVPGQRAMLAYFQAKHPDGADYVTQFDAIFTGRAG
jgi:hypothetical protein